MSLISKDQVKMLLQTIKYLEFDGTDKPAEVSLYKYDEDYFTILNLHGLKHLLRMNKTVFEFNNPEILDSVTDLIANEYEGGFKIWECTEDLLKFLSKNIKIKPNSSVMDVGCGSGLLGIYCLKEKANVHFLDYNKEVLTWFTLINILNNLVIDTENEDDLFDFILNKSKFHPGDWSKVDNELADTKFDLILTSETIYSKDNYTKLLNLFKNHLNSNGEIYVAAKIYYFGLTGGCFEFIEFVEKDNTFDCEVVKTIEDNLQRKIIKLTFKK